MKKYKNVMLFGIGICLVTNQVYAISIQQVESKHVSRIVSITAGINSVNPGKAQSLSLTPPFEDYYSKSSNNSTVGEFGVGLGMERSIDSKSSWQGQISYFINSDFSTKGHVWQFGQPQFDNFKYQYSILHQSVMLSGKYILNSTIYRRVHPYAAGEMGIAFNKAHNYFELPLFQELVPPLPFKSNTKEAFSWGVGLGVSYDVTQRLRVATGYQFTDAGRVSLGICPEAQTDQSLKFTHLYINQFRIQMIIEI